MDNGAKKIGILVAGGLPPPGKLKRSTDEGESDTEAADESDSGDGGGGMSALGDMWDALKQGDKTAAWDAFCDAIDIAKNRDKGDEGPTPSDRGDY